MATITAFAGFFDEMANGTHDFSADTFKLAATNTAPVAATNTIFADITEISAGNGYSAGGATVAVTSTNLSGSILQIVLATTAITASGGSIGPLRYLVLYNDTAASDKLICFIDLGAETTILDGNNITWLTNTAGNIRIKTA